MKPELQKKTTIMVWWDPFVRVACLYMCYFEQVKIWSFCQVFLEPFERQTLPSQTILSKQEAEDIFIHETWLYELTTSVQFCSLD
jgi:hypothetical protein